MAGDTRKEETGIRNSEFIRIGFKEYKKQFDLSSLQFKPTADSINKNNQRMRNMQAIEKAIDSLKREI